MDSLTNLALMTKAQLVFGTPGTFLSFPIGALGYSPDRLSFANSAALTAEQQRNWAEFCQLTNSLPTGTIFQPPPDTYLWDKYREVLKTAILPTGQLSAEQQAALAAAQAYLRVMAPNGSQTDSPALLAYKQCRDAWFKAVQDYNTQKLTASASTDAKQQAQWTTTDEPALRARVTEAEANWVSKGNKAAVEQAQQVETTIGVQSPGPVWRDWASQFNPDIDLRNDPTLGQFGVTEFVPSNAIEETDWWPSFTLSAFEIGRLVGQAPKELAAIFGDLPSSTEIDSISFEYRSVGLRRSWFQPSVLEARCWRFADASRCLSDGGNPAQGECPAYIAAVVLARRIVATVRKAGAAPVPVRLRALPAITQRVEFIPQASPGASATALKPVVAAAPVALHLPQPAPAAIIAAAKPMVHVASPVAAAAKIAAPGMSHPTPPVGAMIYKGGVMWHGPITSPPPPPPPPSPAEPQDQVSNDISILCFICKHLPKSPDPDPALAW